MSCDLKHTFEMGAVSPPKGVKNGSQGGWKNLTLFYVKNTNIYSGNKQVWNISMALKLMVERGIEEKV